MQRRRFNRNHRSTVPIEALESRCLLEGRFLITEIVADNDGTLLDQNEQAADWIEILNDGNTRASLSGLYLTDDPNRLTRWRFPDVELDAGAHLIVFASGQDLREVHAPLHTNFKLSKDGEYVAIVDSDGSTIIDELSFGRQVSGLSFGLGQELERTPLLTRGSPVKYIVPDLADASLGLDWTLPEFDDALWNDGKTSFGFESDSQATAVAYGNAAGSVGTQTFGGALGMDFVVNSPVRVTDLGVFDSGSDGLSRTITAQMWSRSGNSGTRLVEERFTQSDPGELIGGNRFKSLSEPLELAPGDYTIVAYGYGSGEPNGNVGTGGPNASEKTLDDGNGLLSFVGDSRFGLTAGAFPATVDNGPANRYSAGTFRFAVNTFDSIVETNVQSEMEGVNSTVYARVPFDVGDMSKFDRLRLNVKYDDGFAAYLNGEEIARRNAPLDLSWNSTATTSGDPNDAPTVETIDASKHLGRLLPGQNVLSIHGLNVSASDSDFLMDVELEAVHQVGDRQTGYFSTPTPGHSNSGIDFLGLVEETNFSHTRGFFSERFNLAMTSRTPGAEVVFTLDGSNPVVSDEGVVTNGTRYEGPIRIDGTTAVRSIAWKPGFLPSDSISQSYLFLDQVVKQTDSPEGYPSSWRSTVADYGMSQDAEDLAEIAGDSQLGLEESRQVIKESLLALPTMSIVMSTDDLFDSSNGIYANPSLRGDGWERPASVEYLLPNGEPGFQINAGIQIMGGTSRNLSNNIKQSFRLVFKEQYGPSRLNYQFFPDIPITSFNTLALRTNSRDNWTSHQYTSTATYIRDEWAKQTHFDMGTLATTGQFVHLYLNGIYWGIYNPTERPDADFLADHTGVDPDNVDTVKFCCPQRVVDGDWDKWNELRSLAASGLEDNASYQRIQGKNPNGTRNPAYDVLIDVDNFIDYVIHGQFTGSEDWPGNYYVARDRGPDSEGFKFFTWDNDLAFRRPDKVTTDPRHNWWTESPGELDVALRRNEEYRLRFADRVRQHYFDGGALTADAAVDRWNRLADEIRTPLMAESARWGDNRRPLDTPHNRWDTTIDSVADYLRNRPEVVLNQLRLHGLYPEIEAPTFNQHGGLIDNAFRLEIEAALSTVFEETILIAEGAAAAAWVPTSSELDGSAGDPPVWTLPGFDAASWIQGNGGVGYEKGSDYDPFIGIDLLDPTLPIGQGIDADRDGANDNTVVYTRFEFTVADATAAEAEALLLRMRYDDGFIAYLNGTEILRVNAPRNASWNDRASGNHEAESIEEFFHHGAS